VLPRNRSRPPITQSTEPVAHEGRDRRLGLLHKEWTKTYAGRLSAKITWRIGENVFGDLEKLVWRKSLEIWRKMLVGSEKTCGGIRWSFGRDVFGDLEKTYSVIFGENVSAIWRNCSAILEKTVRR